MYTIDQYNKLISAIAQGVHVVKYADKEVTYRSLAEMKALKSDMESELGIGNPARRKKVVLGSFNKGFNSNRNCSNEREFFR